MTKSRILDYILLGLMLPVAVAMELAETSEALSLFMTGGKYAGRGRLARRKTSQNDVPPADWMSPPAYSESRYRHAIGRAYRSHYLEKRISNGVAQLTISEKGKARIFKQIPYLRLAQKSWNGLWLIVSFDIPESQSALRRRIRRRLRHIGFAKWQQSVYVSPHDLANDVRQFLQQEHLEEFVVPLVAKRVLAGDDWEFAKKLFQTDELTARYQHIVKAMNENPTPRILQIQFAAYLDALRDDPFLPIGLVKKGGYGREAAFAALQASAARLA